MTEKPPAWADCLLTVWVVVVGVVAIAGTFVPAIGARTAAASIFYALVLFVSAVVLALRYLHGSTKKAGPPSKRTKP